ncbi:serine hydrolase domain-containing protein [Kordiimonas lacus]|uniref:CubicO group peptidase, beta-lactamase class C family n=1 Tax=Kordiimonas lacus TaxID=637679 RepID=A0A1G6ZZA1_9PROT|nr:serine hydrolase [Kordiimonas lacus]SDE08008.1 CubicO group peptidase, beta-lactamase class C family [Kordiimonas lacus]
MRNFVTAAVMAFGLAAAARADVVDDIAARMRAGDYKGITGMMVSQDGMLHAEAYAPGYGADKRHDIRSATKSITALLVGELIEDGSLKSVKTKLSKILPDDFNHMPKEDPRRDITVEDALTMRTGLACNDWIPASVGQEDKMYKTRDWGAFLWALPMAYERGEHFSYCTGGVVFLGRVIEKLSGKSVPAYAEERLFGPMGIEGAKWEKTPKGHTDTGGHLRLTLTDLHRLGQLVQHGGEGLVDPKWLKEATSEKTQVYERNERYGYLWWLNSGIVKEQPISLVYAHGNGGNFIFVVPELKLVAAFTGKNYGDRAQFIPMQLLTREIIPSLIEEK